MSCMAQNPSASCFSTWRTMLSIIRESPSKSIRLRQRSSADLPTSIPILMQLFEFRQDAFAPSWPSTTHQWGPRTGSWWRCPRVITRLAFTSGLKSFHVRAQGPTRNQASASHEPSAEAANAGQPPRKWVAAIVVLSVVLAAAVAVATDRLLTRRSAEARLTSENPNMPVARAKRLLGFGWGLEPGRES